MKIEPTKAVKAAFAQYADMRSFHAKCIQPLMRAAASHAVMLDAKGKPAESFAAMMESFGRKPADGTGFSVQEKTHMAIGALLGLSGNARMANDPEAQRLFADIVHVMSPARFQVDPYITNIKIPEQAVSGNCTLSHDVIKPCEFFQLDSAQVLKYNLTLPRIGVFDEPFEYPILRQDGKAWMSVTPAEILTMESEIEQSRGNVLTLGLGLGYFAYMASRRPEVASLTVIEIDPDIIELFETYVLPQFPEKDKIRIVRADAVEYVENLADGVFDSCFADLWRTPADTDAYIRLRRLDRKFRKTRMSYWIDDAMLSSIADCAGVLVFRDMARLLEFDKMSEDIKKAKSSSEIPDNELCMLDFVSRLMSREIVKTPADLERVLSIKHVDNLLRKRKTEYVPVARAREDEA